MLDPIQLLKDHAKAYIAFKGNVPVFHTETFGGIKTRQAFLPPPTANIREQQVAACLAGHTFFYQLDEVMIKEGKPSLKESGDNGHLKQIVFTSCVYHRMVDASVTPERLIDDKAAQKALMSLEFVVTGNKPLVWNAEEVLPADNTSVKGYIMPIITVGGVEDFGGIEEMDNPDPVQILMYFTAWLNELIPNKEATEILEMSKMLFIPQASQVKK